MKTSCPICNESITVNKKNEGTIVLCPECDSSLFIAKVTKEDHRILPFSISTPEDIMKNPYQMDEFDDFDFDAD